MRRRARSGGPQAIGDSVARELARAGGSPSGPALGDLVSAWPTAVGEAVSRNAWPARITRDGTLVVHASSSAWAFELTQLEATIRERLGAHAPRALRFVPGPLPEPPATGVAGERRAPVAPTRAHVERAAEVARSIDSEPLREAVARAAAASLAKAASEGETPDPSDRLDTA